MTLEELASLIIQNGFSVAVAAYLLVRMESRLEALTRAIQELNYCLCVPKKGQNDER